MNIHFDNLLHLSRSDYLSRVFQRTEIGRENFPLRPITIEHNVSFQLSLTRQHSFFHIERALKDTPKFILSLTRLYSKYKAILLNMK